MCEGAGWTTRPAGLSITASVASRWTMPRLRSAIVRRDSPQVADSASSATPPVIAMSATLKGGHSGQVDEVGDGADPHPVGEVAERAAGEQADRRATAPGAVGSRANSRRSGQGGQREQDHRGPAAAGEAEGDAVVVDGQDELEPSAMPTSPRRGRGSPRSRLGRLVDAATTRRAQSARRRAPSGARRSRLRSAPTTIACDDEQHDDRDDRAQVEREPAAADRRQEAAEEVEVGVRRLVTKSEHRAQRARCSGTRGKNEIRIRAKIRMM